jgi:agmatinase
MEGSLLYLNENSRKFASFTKESSPFVVIGAPMDITSSYRPGSRFAPSSIREAAQYIEFYSIRNGIDMGEIGFFDAGDVVVHPSNAEDNLRRISEVVKYFLDERKFPITIGGEHTVTVGVSRALSRGTCFVSFDAHLDLREEYMDDPLDHACVMRRIHEQGNRVVEVGTRAVSKEEVEYARKNNISFLTSYEVKLIGARETARRLLSKLSECEKVYVSFDIDVFDPAYAPGVQTPEPEGLDPSTVLDIVNLLVDKRTVGFDVVEVSPPFDPSGITSVLAARLIMETAAAVRAKLP